MGLIELVWSYTEYMVFWLFSCLMVPMMEANADWSTRGDQN